MPLSHHCWLVQRGQVKREGQQGAEADRLRGSRVRHWASLLRWGPWQVPENAGSWICCNAQTVLQEFLCVPVTPVAALVGPSIRNYKTIALAKILCWKEVCTKMNMRLHCGVFKWTATRAKENVYFTYHLPLLDLKIINT